MTDSPGRHRRGADGPIGSTEDDTDVHDFGVTNGFVDDDAVEDTDVHQVFADVDDIDDDDADSVTADAAAEEDGPAHVDEVDEVDEAGVDDGAGDAGEADEASEDEEVQEDEDTEVDDEHGDEGIADEGTEEDEDTEHAGAASKHSGHSGSLKWGLIAVSVLGVVAIALVAVVLLGGAPDSGTSTSGSTTSSSSVSGIASANDTGPVTVITEDPSCAAWTAISTNMSSTLSLLGQGGWVDRDQSIPATAWNDDQKKQYMAAAQVVRGAAAQTVGLVKLTPHRMMRELYEQFIAYSRAFIERIPNYTEPDASLEGTAHSAASALAAICAATANGAAAARGPLLESPSPPMKVAPPGNPTNPQRYLTEPNPVCRDWKAALDKFGADTVDWQNLDPNIPATYWNPQQKQVNLSVAQVMIAYANKLQQLGRRSDNPTLQDFADLSSQYRRAFVLALPTYSPADNYLANAASYASTTVLGACAAAARAG